MKKTLSILFALALLLPAVSAFAQDEDPIEEQKADKQIFNHMSIGVNWGLLGRVGADIAFPLTPFINIRAGINSYAPFFSVGQSVLADKVAGESLDVANLSATGHVGEHVSGMDIENVTVKVTPALTSAELLFDFFPGKKSTFHFTAGAFYSPKPLMHAVALATDANGNPSVLDSDKANTTINGISSDTNGNFILDVKYGFNTIKPYVGIGFGRPVALDRRVGFNFDLGVALINGIHVYSYDYSENPDKPKPVEINSAWIRNLESMAEDESPETKKKMQDVYEVIDIVNNKVAVLPYMRFSLFVRLF